MWREIVGTLTAMHGPGAYRLYVSVITKLEFSNRKTSDKRKVVENLMLQI